MGQRPAGEKRDHPCSPGPRQEGGAPGSPGDYRGVIARLNGSAAIGKGREFLAWVERDSGIRLSRRRDPATVYCRRLVWFVLRRWGLTLQQVGAVTGHDHASVLYGLRKAQADPDLVAHALEAERRFRAGRQPK